MESLHRVTIVLAGVLQAGLQVSSSLPFLLAGGQLSHTLCTLYLVYCTLCMGLQMSCVCIVYLPDMVGLTLG